MKYGVIEKNVPLPEVGKWAEYLPRKEEDYKFYKETICNMEVGDSMVLPNVFSYMVFSKSIYGGTYRTEIIAGNLNHDVRLWRIE